MGLSLEASPLYTLMGPTNHMPSEERYPRCALKAIGCDKSPTNETVMRLDMTKPPNARPTSTPNHMGSVYCDD